MKRLEGMEKDEISTKRLLTLPKVNSRSGSFYITPASDDVLPVVVFESDGFLALCVGWSKYKEICYF